MQEKRSFTEIDSPTLNLLKIYVGTVNLAMSISTKKLKEPSSIQRII